MDRQMHIPSTIMRTFLPANSNIKLLVHVLAPDDEPVGEEEAAPASVELDAEESVEIEAAAESVELEDDESVEDESKVGVVVPLLAGRHASDVTPASCPTSKASKVIVY